MASVPPSAPQCQRGYAGLRPIGFRYPQALGGNPGRSYEHYLSWLRERRLVQDRLPTFAAVLEEVFAETDLLLALCMIGYLNRRTYSGGVARGTIHRLARRFSDSAQRAALAALFESPDDELNNRVDGHVSGNTPLSRDDAREA
jgi:hypothetical protein